MTKHKIGELAYVSHIGYNHVYTISVYEWMHE